MNDFFSLMRKVANTDDRKYDSIMELTRDIAISAGYALEDYTQKNGKTRIRTIYTKPWDDALVAKWFLFYGNYFKSKLYKLPALREYYPAILQRTFSIYFGMLKLDKLESDKAVTAYIKMTFSARIGEAMNSMGSLTKMRENERRRQLRKDIKDGLVEEKSHGEVKNTCAVGTAFNENSLSLDQLKEDINLDVKSEDNNLSSVLIDLKSELEDSDIGLRLLDCMLYSGRKIAFGNLSDYMEFSESELKKSNGIIEFKEETRQQLNDSYNIIISYLKDILPETDFSKTKRTFKYSSKDYCIAL